MTAKFLQANLWNKITALAKSSKHKYVAVAYLGKGASKLLPLKKDDVLVTDLRLETVRAGQVNPFEVEEYVKRGVEVYSYPNLHAKVFIFDRKVIIGSANVSNHSKNSLIETAVLLTDTDVVSAARGFVISLSGAPVTPAYIKSMKKEYHPPIFNRGKGVPRKDKRFDRPRLWIESVEPCEFDEKENRLTKDGEKVAKRKIKNKKKYTVEVIRYGARFGLGKRASLGDLVIQLWSEENGTLGVYPPSRIVHVKPYMNSRGVERKLVFTEEPVYPKCLKWQDFKVALKRIGVTNPKANMSREITNLEQQQSLLGLWTTRYKK